MKLQTKVPLNPAGKKISYESDILLLGSCFVENIGERLEHFKFRSVLNPFGIIYNTTSITRLIDRAVRSELFTADDVFEHRSLYHSYEAHSQLSASSVEAAVDKLNGALDVLKESVNNSTHIFITLGTAWVYVENNSGQTVANCHKVPQEEFERKLQDVETIRDEILKIHSLISSVNPEAQIVFTVSPVRHLKDGFTGNQVSKAHLVAGLNAAMQSEEQLSYFPSYEVVMDELRDYRFYATDLLHLNEMGITYVWECFSKVYFSEPVREAMKKVDNLQKGLRHRVFNAESEEYFKFREKLERQKKDLMTRFPHMKFEGYA
ncbi:GSCFA domain-containing protein [Robertkochia aurantiaca]|uniref:GSCFA domain-containing protein n=1 Tax=Robertkochia aurantiaca TaxID=2873700 RepID=UPI001CCE83F5|nr:GSCFA domain-containing protein [Robertkochia sp. 3YJGBD-33]